MQGLRKAWHKVRDAAPGRKLDAVRDMVRRGIAPRLGNETVVLRLDEPAYRAGPPITWPEGLVVTRHTSIDDLPPEIVATIKPEERGERLDGFRAEFARDGVLWIGQVDGRFAATQWSRRGRYLPDWYIELKPDDIVSYSASTETQYRGRGILPAMLRHVIESEPVGLGEFHCDIFEWNVASLRAFDKAGYREIARVSGK